MNAELARLNDGLLLALQQLMEVLEKTPSQYARALEAVLAHLNNLTHLSNMLRPVQARATLKHMLQLAAEEKRASLAALRANRENVEGQCARTVAALGAMAE